MVRKLINFGIFSILFFSSMVFFKEKLPFEFYANYVPLILLLFSFIFKYRFPTEILYFLFPLLFFGLVNIYFDNNTFPDFLKIFVNIFVGVLFFYYVFEYYERDIEEFFNIYIKYCIVACIICIIQLIFFNLNFKPGWHYGWLGFNKWGLSMGGAFGLRVNGFFGEPSYVASTIGPAFFISFYNIFFQKTYFLNKKSSILIILTYLLTFSSVAYIGIFFVLVLLLINYGFVRYLAFILPLIIFLFYVLYNNVPEFHTRMDGLSYLYVDDILTKEGTEKLSGTNAQQLKRKGKLLRKIHGSSFVQYNHFNVTKENFFRNPLFGTGLGSHGIAFKKYNLSSIIGNQYENNASDANSMLMRLTSETGLFGVIFIFLFIRGNFVKREPNNKISDYHWLISNATLIIILLQLARQGNYTYGGFMAYMWLYYYTKKDYLKRIEEYENKKSNPEIVNDSNLLVESK